MRPFEWNFVAFKNTPTNTTSTDDCDWIFLLVGKTSDRNLSRSSSFSRTETHVNRDYWLNTLFPWLHSARSIWMGCQWGSVWKGQSTFAPRKFEILTSENHYRKAIDSLKGWFAFLFALPYRNIILEEVNGQYFLFLLFGGRCWFFGRTQSRAIKIDCYAF